jgi:oxygen-independent coproporphyrinogen-3 oxidase
MPEEGLAADMYLLTQDIMQARGLPAYEISNHAKLGQASRHNLTYWRGDDYIGIGPGAHGRYSLYGGNASPDFVSTKSPPRGRREALLQDNFTSASLPQRIATETMKSPERWLEKVEQSGTGLISETALSKREHLEEVIMMGLRLSGGIDYADWQTRTGLALKEALSSEALNSLQKQGLVIADQKRICVTREGQLLLNRITAELLAH